MINGLIQLIALVCAIWVIYEIWAKQKSMTTGKKVIWTICAVLFSIITAIVYYFMHKR